MQPWRVRVDGQVDTVGVSSFWHSLVGTDARGRAITPIYTWADSRCREDAARLRTEKAERSYHQQTGCMLRASFWPAKLRWLARVKPRLFARVVRWQSPADWLAGRYCDGGADACAYGMATGTGLFNPRTLRWEADLAELCGLRMEQLCPLSEKSLVLSAKVRRKYPELADARWWPAVGDGAASNLGSGATRPGRAAINVGTSAAFRVMREGRDAHSPFGLFCYRVDAKRYVVGGAVSNAGNLRAWCRRELNLPRDEVALDKALSARPGPLSQSGDASVLVCRTSTDLVRGPPRCALRLESEHHCTRCTASDHRGRLPPAGAHWRPQPGHIIGNGYNRQKTPDSNHRLGRYLEVSRPATKAGGRAWPQDSPVQRA